MLDGSLLFKQYNTKWTRNTPKTSKAEGDTRFSSVAANYYQDLPAKYQKNVLSFSKNGEIYSR